MWIAIFVFIISYIAISTEKFPRHWVAMLGGSTLIVTGILSPAEALKTINWETLGLLIGMFTLVSILMEADFFTWFALAVLKKFHFNPTALFVILIAMAAFLAMFMDSITVMLFLTVLSLQLCSLLKLDPVQLVIAEVCAANAGGAATLVGDPPNVILGTTLGFSFVDFALNTGPLSLIAAAVLLVYFLITNHRELKVARLAITTDLVEEMESLQLKPIKRDLMKIGLVGFGSAVILLIFHLPISSITGLPINSAVAALIPAALAMIAIRNTHIKKVILKVDGESVLFFGGLFLLIGGLEKVELFEALAIALSSLSQYGNTIFILVLHWAPGLLSGIVDNVPLALAMSYVLKDLESLPGVPALAIMVWSLALGVDIGGNLTPVGASANVVAYSILEHQYRKVGWGRWLKTAILPTLLVMGVISVLLIIKLVNGWY